MSHWIPISEHDGTYKPVWLFAPDLNIKYEPKYCGEGFLAEDDRWIGADYSNGEYHSKFVHPLYFQFLPEPPK